jgi:hypothetical protein
MTNEEKIRETLGLTEEQNFKRPTHSDLPRDLWTEILPGLWQGGTHDGDTLGYGDHRRVGITKDHFDSVFTLYADAKPVDWFVKELRFGFYDGNMRDFDPTNDLLDIVKMAHNEWKSGKRVLVRCQAGLNRSGITMALVLIREGYSPQEAIDLIKSERGSWALCNSTFTRWLQSLSVEEVTIWRN